MSQVAAILASHPTQAPVPGSFAFNLVAPDFIPTSKTKHTELGRETFDTVAIASDFPKRLATMEDTIRELTTSVSQIAEDLPPVVLADPEIIRPELERLVSELLPEVVQSVLRHELVNSPRTREAVETAINEVLQRNRSRGEG